MVTEHEQKNRFSEMNDISLLVVVFLLGSEVNKYGENQFIQNEFGVEVKLEGFECEHKMKKEKKRKLNGDAEKFTTTFLLK